MARYEFSLSREELGTVTPGTFQRRISLPARLLRLVSNREAFQSSTLPSIAPCGFRTKAASVATESKRRRLPGESSRRYRRTRISVFPQMPCVTSR